MNVHKVQKNIHLFLKYVILINLAIEWIIRTLPFDVCVFILFLITFSVLNSDLFFVTLFHKTNQQFFIFSSLRSPTIYVQGTVFLVVLVTKFSLDHFISPSQKYFCVFILLHDHHFEFSIFAIIPNIKVKKCTWRNSDRFYSDCSWSRLAYQYKIFLIMHSYVYQFYPSKS